MGRTKNAAESHRHEIRKDGRTYCRWTDPALTYPRETLRNMKDAGYRLYVDGRLQR